MGRNANGNNVLGHFKTLGSEVQHESVFKTNQLADLNNDQVFATPHIGFTQFSKR
jgi:lactate dehydrogenase-like 2-hydroxyacid dehydrogenase